MENPYLVTLRVESRSRKDIASNDFDRQKPLVFRPGTSFAAQIGDSTTWPPTAEIAVNDDEIKIGPCLIHKSLILLAELVTEGQPRVFCDSPAHRRTGAGGGRAA
jgi:hypothetical protein